MFSFEFVYVCGSVLFRQSPRCKPVWRGVNSSSRSVIFCDSISGHVACNLFFMFLFSEAQRWSQRLRRGARWTQALKKNHL